MIGHINAFKLIGIKLGMGVCKAKKKGRVAISSNLDAFLNYSIDPKNRVLYLGATNFDHDGEELGIEAESAERLIKGIYILNKLNSTKPIRLLMNNPGGETFHGWAMYDAISASKAPIAIEVYGHAMSMAVIVLQAGTQRLIHPNGTIMIHDGTFLGGGEIRSNEIWTDFGKKLRKKTYEIYGKTTNRSAKYWETLHANDSIFTAQEALEVGLVDKIVNGSL